MGQWTSDALKSRKVKKKWEGCRVQQRKEPAKGKWAALLVPASIGPGLQGDQTWPEGLHSRGAQLSRLLSLCALTQASASAPRRCGICHPSSWQLVSSAGRSVGLMTLGSGVQGLYAPFLKKCLIFHFCPPHHPRNPVPLYPITGTVYLWGKFCL